MKSYPGVDPATVEPLPCPPVPEKPERKELSWLLRLGLSFLALFLCCGLLTPWLLGVLELPGRLLFGWIPFLARTLPQVSVDPVGVATFAALLAGLAAAVHVLGRWGLPGDNGAGAGRGWGWRSTAASCGLVVSLFAAGVAATGAGHQIGWLVNSPVPLFSREGPGRRSQAQNNLKQIGLALHNYHAQHGRFPAGGTFGPTGRGEHGWATRLLPHLDEAALAERVRWDEPWDAPANREPFAKPLPPFASPYPGLPTEDADGYALAHYAGNARVLTDKVGLSFLDVRDGMTQTLLAGEVADGFLPWAHPANARDPAVGLNIRGGFGSTRDSGVILVLMANGSVTTMSETIDPAVLKALATPAGGETVPEY
ncbi:DUF1559 family PulG-like putative transporter [Alienimonas californiensis]|uniref:DUF1559 domain-containing protein n=1 Tax=Alienimonas californiensis TaxID=2527989 RepID=A0A517P896_9PLAN|nr:DUF1559 domain-containing protein [Alienimonas californiensis]QDT15565.1 hypothetical protein CA12_16500 [Alienimonas californiensis]